jgi:hypothetical protein
MLTMDKQKIHTERNVIEDESIQRDPVKGELIPLFGSLNHLIIAPLHLISICHGENQLALKAESLPSNSAM